MHYYKITLFEKRTVEVFQSGESASEVGKQTLELAEKGELNWALADGKKEYYAKVDLADDHFSDCPEFQSQWDVEETE